MYFTSYCSVLILLVIGNAFYCEIVYVPRKSRIGETRSVWYGNLDSRQPPSVNSISSRQGRFFSLFTYVQLSTPDCVNSDGELGNCITATDCSRMGGKSKGTCANGYGVCCMFLATCGRTIVQNGTYFVNNGYPNQFDGTASCQATLIKSRVDVCQFRLDFSHLQILGPESTNHICNNDQFIVSGGNNPIPTICGTSDGNHVYVDAGMGITNPITISVVTSGPSFERLWKIRITQIPCSSNYKADDGCLQYFTGVAGQISSFNYDPVRGGQLSNQDYGVCIRAERNFCGIQYTQCPDNASANNINQSFTLSGNSNTRVQSMVGSTGPNSCQMDYLIIPMASNVGRPATGLSSTVDRICGGILGADVTSTPTTIRSTVKPFHLWFHTDGLEYPTDVDNKGFCLNYVQQPCTNG